MPTLAVALAPGLDRVDPALFARFFEYGDPTAQRLGQPSHAGHYLGYLVAQRLGAHRTLADFAATGTVPAGR